MKIEIDTNDIEGYEFYTIKAGDKFANQLTYDEALGLVSVLLMPKNRIPCLQWLKTKEEHEQQADKSLRKKIDVDFKEPKIDMSKEILDRAYQWVAIGETGLSSKTMWNCFMSVERGYPIHYPHDVSDFYRCYKLLEAVPEWKSQMSKLKKLSPVWERFVVNWDVLTKKFEENDKGFYDFIQKVINNEITAYYP